MIDDSVKDLLKLPISYDELNIRDLDVGDQIKLVNLPENEEFKNASTFREQI